MTEVTMFPTRTTSTTGTLHVSPAAAATAATTFGWAIAAHPAPTRPRPGAAEATPTVPSPSPSPEPSPRGAEPPTAPTRPSAPRATDVGAAPTAAPASPGAAQASAVAALHAVSGPAVPARPSASHAASVPASASAGRASSAGATPAPYAAPAAAVPATHGSAPTGEAAPASVPAPAGVAPPRAAEPPAAFAPHAVPASTGEPSPGEAERAAVPASDPPGLSVPHPAPALRPGPFGAHASPRPAGFPAPHSEPMERDRTEPAPAALDAQPSPRSAQPQPGTGFRSAVAPARSQDGGASGPVPGSAARAADAPLRAAESRTAPFGGQAPPRAAEPEGEGVSGPSAAAAHASSPAAQPPAVPSAEAEGVPAEAGPRIAGARAGDPAVPAARGQVEPEPVHASTRAGAGASLDIPHPQHEEPATPRSRNPADAAHSGVPGPGVAEIVAQAVARGIGEDDTLDLPHVVAPRLVAPHRGTAVTDVPVHLPFRGDASTPRPEPAPKRRPTAPAHPAPGRRVPRGDDRLREHRGPVLPGWVGVAVGGLALAGCTAVLWRAGVVPAPLVAAFGAAPRAYHGLRATHWPPLAFLGIVALVALGGLGRARTGHAWVLTLFGRYRGTVRRTGLTWVSPLLLRRRVDVRLRHWRSEPMPAVDSGGLALQVVVQVVWQVKDTARATLAVADHTEYLAEQVESAMARVLSQLPADAFHEDAPTLRDAEAVGDALTRMLAAETEAVGVEVYSAQPTRIEYAPEVAEAMRRRRVAAIDAKHRDTVLTSVVDAVDDTVHRLTSRGLVELDDYERKALVKDLTVAFYTGRSE
ncbi:SPFH domain-containing protein [Streptomyces virginiae]|uniref:SPFH domain-containing protein n=1 Tax=Streptomyces virginiae TaxID=1961 RepID=UPI0033B24D81